MAERVPLPRTLQGVFFDFFLGTTLLLLHVCACNGGDDADGGRVLGELSGDEVQALCDSIEGELARTRTVQARCTLEAASSTDSAPECELERDECVQAGGNDVTTRCTLPERRSDEPCADLQVDEVLPCVEQIVDARLAVSCDDARYVETQPECIARLSAQCPFGP